VPTKKNRGKTYFLDKLLEKEKLDMLVIAETALSKESEKIVPHDNYSSYFHKID
jgi:hypothetical protein